MQLQWTEDSKSTIECGPYRLVHYIPSLMNPCTSFVSTDQNLGYLMMIFFHKSILQGFMKHINLIQ